MDAVAVRPDIVNRNRVSAPDFGQVLEQPGFTATKRVARCNILIRRAGFDERSDAHGGNSGAERVMSAGHRREDIQVLGFLGRSPGAIFVLIPKEKVDAAPNGFFNFSARERFQSFVLGASSKATSDQGDEQNAGQASRLPRDEAAPEPISGRGRRDARPTFLRTFTRFSGWHEHKGQGRTHSGFCNRILSPSETPERS
jgi:hypothetical protein